MRAATWLDRLAPAAGAVGAILVFVGSVTASRATEETDPTRSGAAIAATFGERSDEARAGVGVALVGAFLLLCFVGWLREHLPSPFGAVALAGGAVGVSGFLPYLAILVAESNDAITSAGDAARALLLLQWEYGGVVSPGWAAFVGATSIGLIRGRLLPRWLAPGAWLGVVLAAALAFSGFLGGFLVVSSLIWIAGAALALVLRPPQPDPAGARAPR